MSGSWIVAGARTPIGKMSGAFAGLSAAELGGLAIADALRRAGVEPARVDHVVMGQVLGAGQGQVPARQAAVKAGIPMRTPSVNVNKVCLSGLNAIHVAHLMIAAGDADVVVAGGMESMTNAPYLLPGARSGLRYGNAEMQDAIVRDGLWCAFDACLMGLGTERYGAGSISREDQDAFAARSHALAAAAAERLAEEIVPVAVPQRKGDPVVVARDEGVRADATAASLGGLRPAFDPKGTITAGNASQISDGGAALVVASERAVREMRLMPLGRIAGYGMVAGPDTPSLLLQPALAARAALARAGATLDDAAVVEINEAFAAVGIASTRDLGIDPAIVNPNGGAIAVGHPIGMSGARLALTLLHELRRRGARLGVAALCGGGGQGDAVVLEAA
jgi:acetyl-CoA C-acetyltransferase